MHLIREMRMKYRKKGTKVRVISFIHLYFTFYIIIILLLLFYNFISGGSFQLILLNKQKKIIPSCLDISPHRPYQEMHDFVKLKKSFFSNFYTLNLFKCFIDLAMSKTTFQKYQAAWKCIL